MSNNEEFDVTADELLEAANATHDDAPATDETPEAVGYDEALDTIEIAAPTPITTKRKSRVGTVGLLMVATAVGGGWAFKEFGGEDLLNSKIARAPRNIDATPGGEQLAVSPRYQQGIQKVNVEGAEEAFTTPGKSFIPIPDKAVEPAMLDIDPPEKAKLKPPALPAPNKAPVVAKAPELPKPEPEVVEKIKEVPVYYEVTKPKKAKPQEDDYSDIDALLKAMERQADGLGNGYGRARGEVIIRQDLAPGQEGLGRNSRRRGEQSSSLATDAGTYGADPSIGFELLNVPKETPNKESKKLVEKNVQPSSTSPSLDNKSKTKVIDRQDPIDAGTYGADSVLGADYLTAQPRRELPVATGVMPTCFNPYGYGPKGVFGCPDTAPGGILAKAGDVVYAHIINGTDTDTPGPIVARVTSGELRGAKLIGSFTANRETTAMIVSFDRVVLEDGTNLPTTAYAVDAVYGDLAIRSRFKGRYFQRYAPKLAGAFLRGTGTALAATGSQVVGVGETAVVVTPEQTGREAVAAGVADVGNQLASEIENLGPEGPLVQLFAGKPIGVLWLANVQAPSE